MLLIYKCFLPEQVEKENREPANPGLPAKWL